MPKASDYDKMSQHEHVLARPDSYVGSVAQTDAEVWVFDEGIGQMRMQKISYVPGLFKIFDEILVNAADNKVRDPKNQTLMKVEIDEKQGKVSVYNNGSGIPVEMHPQHKMMVPEMIFGHLLTSSNYDDTKSRITGGRNGFGAKLTNVFSSRFEVETAHKRRQFKMVWKNNMLDKEEATVNSYDDEDYTKVSFWPDFKKFGMRGFEEGILLLMKRRVYDIAGTTDSDMKVKLNGKTLPVRTFQDYVNLFPSDPDDKKPPASYAKIGDRWEVCVRVSSLGYQQCSFVNSMNTLKGGNHVNYIVGQIVDKVTAQCKKKHKDIDVKPYQIKQNIWIFVKCLIDNPTFNAQTKEELTTTKANFGSSCELPASLLDYIVKSPIVERTVMAANTKYAKLMAKNAGAQTGDRSRITGIPKLEDANDAGTRNSHNCTLILTEGDSAKALAVSGLGTVGRDLYGVFPLRGKPLNVRDVSLKRVLACEEISAVIKIMGLKVDKKYTDTTGLRYGRIMIMADQDHDGSHIKGLIINFIHHFWPDLAQIPGFITQFITPIVKASPVNIKKPTFDDVKAFYSVPAFLNWKEKLSPQELKKWTFKYYKGLGTSTSAEGREYFSRIRDHRIKFVHESATDDERIRMAFSKDRVEDRKTWIMGHDALNDIGPDFSRKEMKYETFIDKELIQFSIADCERSIPNVIDGLKPGQRKIMYCCFKRNLTRIIKVAQLAGYVSEHSAYHHGEQSLTQTIVGLAQDFVGANNLPLLYGDGQFGTRLSGGKDHASARYIFTRLSTITRAIFRKEDDFILDYKDDDGFPVEPHFYVPVIPMALVNGTSGIGTGFATSIPNYNPMEIVDNVRRLIRGEEPKEMYPWYYGFTGAIEQKEANKFVSRGKVTVREDGVVNITELPIGSWTVPYKKFLEELIEKEYVVSFREHHTDVSVDFDIYLQPAVLRQWQAQGVLEKRLELSDTIAASNITAFDEKEKLHKFGNAEAVLKQHYIVRLEFYQKRKDYLLGEMKRSASKLANMVRFIHEVIDGKFVVQKRKKAELLVELRQKKYDPFPPQSKRKSSGAAVVEDNEKETNDNDDDDDPIAQAMRPQQAESPEMEKATRDYDYLLGQKLWSLTHEMIARLEEQLRRTRADIQALEGTSPKELWLRDLKDLEDAINAEFKARSKETSEVLAKAKNRQRLRVPGKVPLMSEKAKKELEKDQQKVAAKAPKDPNAPKPARKKAAKKKRGDSDDDSDDYGFGQASGGEDSDDDLILTTRAPPKKRTLTRAADNNDDGDKKPKAKRAPRKKKTDDADSDAPPKKAARGRAASAAASAKKRKKRGSSDDDDDSYGPSSSSDSDDDDVPFVAKKSPAKPRTVGKSVRGAKDDASQPKSETKRRRTEPAASKKKSEGTSKDKPIEEDDFDWDDFGLDALAKPKAKASPKKTSSSTKAADATVVDDDSDDDLLGVAVAKKKAAPAPKRKASPKKAAPAKKKKKESSSDDDGSDDSYGFGSSSDDDDDDSDDNDSSEDSDDDDDDSDYSE